MSRRFAALMLVLPALSLSLAACGDEEEGGDQAATVATQEPAPAEPATTPDDTTTEGEQAAGDCTPTGEEGPKTLPCPTQVVEKGDEASVVFKTSEGSFTVELDTDAVPATANNLAYLAQKKFFDGLDFHRVVPGFVIQGGDPNGDGSGGPGYQVVEAPPSDLQYTKGIVAMAKSGADPAGASGSQFFVVSGEDAGLPPEYAYAGKVTKGLKTVEKIAALGEEGADGPPSKEVKITSATLQQG